MPSQFYKVQSSPTPGGRFSTIALVTAGTDGVFRYEEEVAGDAPQFYRFALP